MEALILAVYSFFVWLIFIKLKWLPWNTQTQVTVIVIPIVGLTTLVLLLNIFAPSSADVRVIKYVVQVVPQVRGIVTEVPVEGNRPVRKGAILFRTDPTPFQLDVRVLEAQLASAEGSFHQLQEQLLAARSTTRSIRIRLELAQTRAAQNEQLAKSGAGDIFSFEQATTNFKDLQAQLQASLANEAQIRAHLSATAGGDQAEVAQIKAALARARWELSQTVFYAPEDGTVINLQLRPGQMATALGMLPVMTFVEEKYQIIALFDQNELHQVQAGDEAEIALNTYPGRIIKCVVDSIVWAQGQGQISMSATLPQTGIMPAIPGRFAVRLRVADRDRELFLAAGAAGHGAIYTAHLHEIQILRKVIIRVGAYMDYLILKLH